jgi:hypothetical protein
MRWAVILTLSLLACGKHDANHQPLPSWDNPSEENGFHAVLPPPCPKIEGGIENTQTGTLQDIAVAKNPSVVAADDRFVYWAEDRLIRRAFRATSPWPSAWGAEDMVLADRPVVDLAVTNGRVYWVGDAGRTRSISFIEKKGSWSPQATIESSAPLSRLVARGSSLLFAFSDSSNEIDDTGRRFTLPVAGMNPSPVIAADDRFVYTADAEGFIAMTPRRHTQDFPKRFAKASQPSEMLSDGAFVYWVERGGKLRRVPVTGPAVVTDLYLGIPSVQALAMVKGILWISTDRGLLRYDPSCHLPPARVAAMAGLHGHPAPFGEALAVLAVSPVPRVALLASP